jgi:hypothetical protein
MARANALRRGCVRTNFLVWGRGLKEFFEFYDDVVDSTATSNGGAIA